MENVFNLINNRLHNLVGAIKQHKYCIENNLDIGFYEGSLVVLEKEYSELQKEYEELKQYCISRKV